jgi:hypothetical protein
MAPADHTYRVRPASSADLPAVLAILAESRAERPGWAVPSAGGPSRRQEAAWERCACRKSHPPRWELARTEVVRLGSGGRGWFPPGGPAGCAMIGLCFRDWPDSA